MALLLFTLVCMTRRQIPQVVSTTSGDDGFKDEINTNLQRSKTLTKQQTRKEIDIVENEQ